MPRSSFCHIATPAVKPKETIHPVTGPPEKLPPATVSPITKNPENQTNTQTEDEEESEDNYTETGHH
jgi:hypothetical protein